jgi:2-methylcitrate dehydratase PrpD
VIQAQFSLSFGVAAALVYGDLAPEAYHELGNPTLTRLEALVDIVVDPSRTTRGAHLSLTTDKEVLEAEAAPLPDRMPKEAVIAKFTRYATPIIGPERGKALIAALLDGDLQRPIGPAIFQ